MRENIEIIVTEKGVVKVRKQIKKLGTEATQASTGVDFLKNALKTFAGAAVIKQLIGIADAYTNIQNRLKNVTKNSAELNLVTKELFAVSNRTRSSFEGTAEVFARTALALKDVGISQREMLQFTESLNQAVILSGASAAEAQAGLIQLSQGLASGTLRGDELRSVLEQLPAVADVISKRLGITRGELRKLGQDGKITSKIILESFQSARGELAEKFGKTVPTVGQSFQILQNNVTGYIGELDKASGATALLSKSLLFVSDNLTTLSKVAFAATIALGASLTQRGVLVLTAAIKGLGVAIKTNPLGALLQAAILVGSVLVSFSDQLKLSSDGLATLQDFFVVTFDLIQSVVGQVTTFIADRFGGAFDTIKTVFGDTKISFKSVITFFAKGADNLLGIYLGVFNAIREGAGLLPKAVTDITILTFNKLIGIAEGTVNKIIAIINPIVKFAGGAGLADVTINRLENSAKGGAKQLGNTVKEAFLKGLDVRLVQNTVTDLFNRADNRAKQRLIEAAKRKKEEEAALSGLSVAGTDLTKPAVSISKGPTFASILADLQVQNQLLKLNTREREIAAGVIQIEDQLKRKLSKTEKELTINLLEDNRQLEEQSSILDEIRGPQQNFAVRLNATNQLLKQGKIGLEEYKQKLIGLKLESLQTDRTLEGGLQRGLLNIGQQFGDISRLAESTVVDAFGTAEDALVSFAETGKVNIKSMVDSIFKDLLRLSIRSAITSPLANAIGGAAATGAGSAGGDSGILTSLLSGGGGARAAGGGGGFSAIAGLSSLFGFRDGNAEFRVGGVGGPDSQLVAFKASPNETVNVTKPGQSVGGTPINITFNIQTPDADSFQRSQSQILAKTQASLTRANRRNN